MMGESWEADGPDEGDCVDGYAVTWAREFRYDAARARYLNRELDPEALEEGDLVALSEVWTDYDGDSSYGDFELAGDPLMPSDLRSYEPGVALKDPWDESSGIESSGIEYYHADLIGTTRGTTDDLGAPAIGASGSPVTYTAFGERLDSDDHLRYGYAGSWGYQAHDVPDGDPVQFLHVGWRYYDPSTGRFLQRDPIGFSGGSNVYTYGGNIPTISVDPEGQIAWVAVIIGVAIVIDWLAEYANAPEPDGVILSGTAGPNDLFMFAGPGCVCRGAARAARASGWSWRAGRYPNAGGGGISIARHGKRVAGIDYHSWGNPACEWYKRLHYHWGKGRPGKLHRPWQKKGST